MNSKEQDFKSEIIRYITFWPFFLISVLFFIISSFIYLRYSENIFKSSAVIEIIDKAQDSEMALPTAMTVFNRSMINLENEIGVLESFYLHKKVVEKNNFNVKYYTHGNVLTTEDHVTGWIDGCEINFLIDLQNINEARFFNLENLENSLKITEVDEDQNTILEYTFKDFDSNNHIHELPFEIKLEYPSNLTNKKSLMIFNVEEVAKKFKSLVKYSPTSQNSDQIIISMDYSNKLIANDYINILINEFDRDGIYDRQLEYKRTMDFVDSRSVFLSKELEEIELRKQQFKQKNELNTIDANAEFNISKKSSYDADLFDVQSEIALIDLVSSSVSDNEINLIPINLGLDENNLNKLIQEYNALVSDIDKYMGSAGGNNSYVKSLKNQLEKYKNNIKNSVIEYKNSLDIKLKKLEEKEREFTDKFKSLPEKEKILRAIERELEVKESLFLLLLTKREEAAINFAVVKPSIKVIDAARSSVFPISPNKRQVYFVFISLGLFIPFSILFLRFFLDNKIHTKDHLIQLTANKIPVIGEVPFIKDVDINFENVSESRDPISESIRIMAANLDFSLLATDQRKVILVTSSVKGEGKTLISVKMASIMATKYRKVLLIGADLRNPQIHKFLKVDKNNKGLSDMIYSDTLEKYKDLLFQKDNLDILISGTIPPNPTELLSSKRLGEFIKKIKDEYDFIIFDSAPCLLVSDTYEISKYIDQTVYVVRANYSEKELANYILENNNQKKIKNINMVLNSVGNSRYYGYKYGYQYGYKYSYKYGYNYGYGYGYNEDK